MKLSHWAALAACLFAFDAHAQKAHNCPTLPAGAGLSWDVQEGPDFLYCKAIRDSDAGQSFAVMLREQPLFRPTRALRGERAVIDGRETRWYRSEVATQPELLVRETLVEVDREMTAHIVLRAADSGRLAEIQQQAEALRFDDLRIGSH